MESSTIMGDPSPRQARSTDKLAAVMTETGPFQLLRLVRRVRLLPKNPPPHAVTLAAVTAGVLGAATGVVLAFVAPATPESNDAPPVAIVKPWYPEQAEVERPRALAVGRSPEAPATSPSAEPPAEVEPAIPTPSPSPMALAPSPPVAARMLPTPSPAPRATARLPATRTPAVQANTAVRPVSPRTSAASGSRLPVAAVEPPPLGLGASDAPMRPAGEGSSNDSSAAEELIWLAERAFQSGHPAEAVRLGKKALAAHGGARAHLALAAAYFDLRRFDDALASYEAVLQTEPANQAARIGLDLVKTTQARPVEPQQP